MEIKSAAAIKPYQGPQWLIEDPTPIAESEVAEMNEFEDVEILDRNILGWGQYNAVIKATDLTLHLSSYYLAEVMP